MIVECLGAACEGDRLKQRHARFEREAPGFLDLAEHGHPLAPILEHRDDHTRIAQHLTLDETLSHDDGVTHRGLEEADIILVGVSRSGKTPTCLYMAMQFGIKAANYPLIPEDLEEDHEEILREMARARGESVNDAPKGLFGFGRKKKK